MTRVGTRRSRRVVERRIHRELAVGIRTRRRTHVVVDATVLVIQHEEQRRLPGARAAKLADISDEMLAERDVVRRMLVVRLPLAEVEVARLDEGIRRQVANWPGRDGTAIGFEVVA